MDRQVRGPDGTIHVFPDDATDQEISAALDAAPADAMKKAPPNTKRRTWTDTAIDLLPAAGGAIGGIVGGIGGTVAGMGVGGLPGAIGGATVGGAAGEGFRQAIQTARGVEAPRTTGQALTGIGQQAALQGGAEAVGGAVGTALRPIGAALMQSAVKPGAKATARAIFRGVATEDLPVVKTLLKEGVNVTRGGIAKLDKVISATNEDVAAAVAAIPGEINPFSVTKRLGDTARKFEAQVNPEQSLRQIQEAGEEFLRAHGDTMLDPTRAQALKQGTYRQMKDTAYGQLSSAQIEAQKDLARGLKEEIEAEYAKSLAGIKQRVGMGGVDVAAANAREGAAITAKEAIAKRLAAAGNGDPGSLAWLAHNPVAGLTFVAAKSPAVKSLIARGAFNAAGSVAKINPQVIRVLVESIATQPEETEP